MSPNSPANVGSNPNPAPAPKKLSKAEMDAKVRSAGELLRRAHDGDPTCKEDVRKLFRDPAMGELMRAYGSPPDILRNALVASAAGTDLAVREASSRMLATTRASLEGVNPSPLEALLAERATLCWWIVNRCEAEHVNAKNLTPQQIDAAQKRIDRAHTRFLSAIKTLATVRKLALPNMQINIGANQVNTLATGGDG